MNDKTLQLLRMTEQPKRYSEEEWRTLFADDECRKLYDEMSALRGMMMAEQVESSLTDEAVATEWKRLPLASRPFWNRHTNLLYRVAAAIVVLLFVGGITWAAMVLYHSVVTASQVPLQGDSTIVKENMIGENEELSPKLFDDVPLENVLAELADIYGLRVVYHNESVRRLRLYYQWKPTYSVEKVVQMLNTFEAMELSLDDDTLIVESDKPMEP